MGSKGGSTTTGSFSPPPEFTKAYKEALGMARTATGKPYEQYSGNLVAGLTPSQTQGISNVNAAQGMALPAIQQGMQYTNQAAQGVTPELYQRFYSPYVKDVANTTFGNLMESQAQQQSNLKSGAIQAGAFGGDRGGIAQAEMARQQQLGNAMAMSNIYNQGYGQAMGLAGQQVANLGSMGQQIAGLGAGAQASVLQGAQAQMAAGAQQQATEQARLQAAYDQWTQRQAYPYQQAQFFANIAQGLGAGAGGTSSTTAPAPNMFSQIMGGVGAIGSIYGASDKRVKENIEEVGSLNDGQTIYRYNFKGDPKTQIGLLAQEVETRKPGSVAQVNGLKMVNYKDATEDAAEMSSAGGFVAPSEYRQGLAGGGGIPFYPYADARTYVPEGKFDVRKSNMPSPPDPFEDKGLAEDWKNISPLSKEQASGLRALASDVGIDLPEKGDISKIFKKTPAGHSEAEQAWIYRTNPDSQYAVPFGNAAGGVVGRNHYANGGVSMMDQAIDEAAGLGAVPDPEVDPRLARMESGGDFGAKNEQGYVGRMQFGPERLTDAKRAGIIPADMSSEGFRGNEEAQKATEAWHFGDINNFIDKSGLAAVEGKSIKGIPVTRQGLVNVAHLGGKTGLQKFVASGGRYDPADANGTRLSDYLALASNEGGVGGAMPVPASAEGLSAVVEPASAEGLGGAEEPKTGLNFDMKKLIASEENPSLIEKVMGRRLSPEARSAVMNASFALMAGRSPFFFTNLGEAGKVGTQTYYNALKQGADIELASQERETQRMNAETMRVNAARQLYSQMLPQIKFWQMRNPGKPLPLEYRRVIDAAYPPEGPAGLVQAPGIAPQLAGPAAGGAPAPAMPEAGGAGPAPSAPGEMPPASGAEAVTPPGEAVAASSAELNSLYSQLPDEQNPNYWTQMAQNAMTTEDYTMASQRAAELTKQYQENGIPLPSGVVPFPGSLEMQAQKELNKLQTAGAYEATTEQTKRAQTTIANSQNALNTLEQAAQKLRSTTTGQLEDTKAYLVTALNSLGLSSDAERLDQAAGVQELNKIFSQILFSGGLKDKIGSQIAATELQMFSRGFGDVSLEPQVNRFIVGTMRGILNMEIKRAQDWISFVDENGGKPPSRREITSWEIEWNKENPITSFVEPSIANTPVKGELNFSDPSSRAKAKPGYKYILPDGKVAVYNGSEFELEE